MVLTSGYSNVLAENAHRGFELIQKPYSVESLSRILRKAISDARLQPKRATALYAASSTTSGHEASSARISLAGRAALNR